MDNKLYKLLEEMVNRILAIEKRLNGVYNPKPQRDLLKELSNLTKENNG